MYSRETSLSYSHQQKQKQLSTVLFYSYRLVIP